jgi:hypothetical protein
VGIFQRTDRLEGVMLYSLTLFHGGDKNIIEYTDRDYMRSLYKNVPWRGKNFIIISRSIFSNLDKGNNKITELLANLQRESQNS